LTPHSPFVREGDTRFLVRRVCELRVFSCASLDEDAREAFLQQQSCILGCDGDAAFVRPGLAHDSDGQLLVRNGGCCGEGFGGGGGGEDGPVSDGDEGCTVDAGSDAFAGCGKVERSDVSCWQGEVRRA
jgi:hypothetical protein